MRIAQVSPLMESVPPHLYGGTERVVSFLTEELVTLGHEVTLFASGDSVTRAKLVACTPRALRLDRSCVDATAHHVRMLDEVCRRARSFDVIHFHIDYLHFPLSPGLGVPHVTTLHGRQDIPDLAPLYRTYAREPLISISDAQRRPLPDANWQATVYHGLPRDRFHFHPGPGEYLAFLGRISPEKRVDRAIDIARRLDMPLKIAAKVDNADQAYFEREIKPRLDDPLIEFVGEIDEQSKDSFLGQAAVLLFPIDWPEPFGLVMIEAMACGTPVVAFRCGSVPEVMDEGASGFVVDDLDQAVDATRRALMLPRARCRQTFERRFLARRMAEDYLRVYRRLANLGPRRDHAAGARMESPAVSGVAAIHPNDATTALTGDEDGKPTEAD
ncbi:MAG TPA: glycosyltransferase family 4 protein [Polyangia bacterium]|nr:glycosyltransferase family 4 protein [Polyangia bacterium]